MVAALRLILGSRDALTTVSAQSCLLQSHLPPVDTVDAVLRTKSGAPGVLSLSYGSLFRDSVFEFACEGGVVSINGDKVTVNDEHHDIPFEGRGVAPEVAEFAESIAKGRRVEKRQSPEEALGDLEMLEKMLASGEQKGERVELSQQ